ncbi:hypothetical protein CCP3SC1AL1_150013 [Gammaproteobacteria bacterium]
MGLLNSVFTFLARKIIDLLKKSCPGTLVGTVRDSNGNAVFGVEVTAGGKRVCTARSGRYVIGDLPPGTLQINLSFFGKTETNIEQVSIGAGQKLELDLEMPASLDSKLRSTSGFDPVQIHSVSHDRTVLDPVSLVQPAPTPNLLFPPVPSLPPAEPGSLTGVLRDSDGNPVAGIEVTIGGKSACTAKSGKYAIVDLLPNTYKIDLSFGNKTEKNVAQALIQSEQTLEKDLRLPISLSGTIAGIIRDSAGNPVVGAEVIIGSRKTLTGKPGKYVFNDLPIGTLQIDLSLGDKTEKKVEQFLIQPGQTLEKNLRLPIFLGGAITGIVRCSNNNPASGITVFAGGKTARTDKHGKYLINDLPPGLVQMDLLYLDQKEGNVEQLLVKLGQTLEQDLRVAIALIRGRYLDNGDGTVTDLVNKLRWKRCCEGQVWTGTTCKGEATKYQWEDLPKPSNGWRVPTIEEAKTLLYCRSTGKWGESLSVTKDSDLSKLSDSKICVCGKNISGTNDSPAIDQDIFINAPLWIWTASEYEQIDGEAWIVGFVVGYVGGNVKGSNGAVRVVSSSR